MTIGKTAARTAQSTGSKHPDRVRMLVLETDQTLESTGERKGSFGKIFHDLFTKAGKQHDPPLEVETIMKFVVEPEGGRIPSIEDVDDIHAVVLSGSKHDAHGDDEWIVKLIAFIQQLWREKPDIRFSGVCFGHQLLCRALGSKVEPSADEEWELSHTRINLTSTGASLFRIPKNSPPILHLHQMHVDHVLSAPTSKTSNGLVSDDTNVAVWGSSKNVPVQGIYIREKLFTSQGHLGYDEQMVKEHIDSRVNKGLIDDEAQIKEAKDKAGWEHDGLVVAGAILRFFHGEDKDIAAC